MNPLYPVANAFAELARTSGWRFALIGGLAVGRWGRPRATDDIDFSLWVEFGEEAACIHSMLERFSPRMDDAESFAMANRILLLVGAEGVPLDIALASFPFEQSILARATDFEFAPGICIPTVGAEDLIFLKACANRELDWIDIESIMIAQGPALDWRLVESQLASIREVIEYDDILLRLQALRSRLEEAA